MENTENYIGRTIRIINLAGETEESMKRYRGKTGTVEVVNRDAWGETQLWGTWGGIAIYLDKDEIEIIK